MCCYIHVYLPVVLQTTVSWEGDKLKCVQLGEKAGRGWTHWLEGDKLHLVRIKRGSGTGGVVERGRRKNIKCSCKRTPMLIDMLHSDLHTDPTSHWNVPVWYFYRKRDNSISFKFALS